MTLGVSLIIIAVGAILAWAVHPQHPGSVNVNTAGYILMVVGFVAFLLDLVLWSEWGPGYLRRRTVVAGEPYAAYPARRAGWPRRRVVQEEVVEQPGGPPVPPP